MKFDKSKVFTAVNADELKVGSKVIVADNMEGLKICVKKEMSIKTMKEVLPESNSHRFVTDDDMDFLLAYLIEPPEEKKLKWTDLKIGDVIRKKYEDGYRFAMVTRIDTYSCDNHIGLCFDWLTDEDLAKWEKVE